MVRLKGLGSFVTIVAIVAGCLRLVHVGVPLFIPNTRPGPFTPATLDEVPRYAGFAAMVPAYRPASLGDQPARLTVWLSPEPTVALEWTGEHWLKIVERAGGARPARAPTSRPLDGLADSAWWQDAAGGHLVTTYGGLWIELSTDLDPRELKRFADTLTR